jgi:hypothetical protein
MKLYAGAWSHQRDNTSNVLASVERRTLGDQHFVMLVSLEGDMASIALEVLKNQFAAVTTVADSTATALVNAVPAMLATSVALALITSETCFSATRNGAVFLQRASVTTTVVGRTMLQANDYVIVSTRTEALTLAVFDKQVATADALRNDLLDDVLKIAASQRPNVGVAAARCIE